MVECDPMNLGCSGGILPVAWSYLTWAGVTSEDCRPYHSGDGHTETCPRKKCAHDAVEGAEYSKYKCKLFGMRARFTQGTIKKEILKNGPVETGFTVYEDFMSYKTGIYQHTTGKMLGGHAVTIIGWGVEEGTKYWLCQNSWGAEWGDQGYFKIKIGNSGMNQQGAYGCEVDLSGH
jgi:cathepsin B